MSSFEIKVLELEHETNNIIKLFKLIDTYEYILKILTINQLQTLVQKKDSIDLDNKSYINLCNLFISNFQRPSFGHWINLLRDTSKINGENLKKILKNADKIIVARNQFAHGITPTDEESKSEYEKLYPILVDLHTYLQNKNIYEQTKKNLELTPFSFTIFEIFNGVKKGKLVYLNYDNGVLSEKGEYENFVNFYDTYFKLQLNISNDEVLSLLDDYFPREYWENKINETVRENNFTFIYGYAGVGKTILSARMSQVLDCSMYRFASTNKDSINTKKAFIDFYESMRLKIGGVSKIVYGISKDELKNSLIRLSQNSLKLNEQHHFIFDGLDEIEDTEFQLFCEFLTLFKNSQIHFVLTTRNKELSHFILQEIKNMQMIELESLTELEIKEWLRYHSSKIQYPSEQLLKHIYSFSKGNFLFLSNIANNKTEDEYFTLIQEIPQSVQEIFSEMSRGFAEDIELLLAMVIIPGVTSKQLLQKLFDLDITSFENKKQNIQQVIKEKEPGMYLIFHDKYHEYLKNNYPVEIEKLTHKIIDQMQSLKYLITPYSSIVDIFLSIEDYDSLFDWLHKEIYQTSNHNIYYKNRYEYVITMQKILQILMSLSWSYYERCLDILNMFISKNFQLLIDWKICVDLSKSLDQHLKYIDITKYEYINLLYGCNLHVLENLKNNNADYTFALDYLRDLNLRIQENTINKLRVLDYIGLTYSQLGNQYEEKRAFYKGKAIDTFSEVILISKNSPNNVWVGYAKMNRGNNYRDKAIDLKEKAIQDIEEAVEIRKNIAQGSDAFEKSLVDIGSQVQALLTLAMGYENLLQFYYLNTNEQTKAELNAFKLEESVRSALNINQTQTQEFFFTCRVLVTLCEYYISLQDKEKCNDIFQILKDVYIPENRIDRFYKIKHYLLDNSDKKNINSIVKELRSIKSQRDIAEENENEDAYDENTEKSNKIKDEILKDNDLLQEFLDKFSISKMKLKKIDLLDIL